MCWILFKKKQKENIDRYIFMVSGGKHVEGERKTASADHTLVTTDGSNFESLSSSNANCPVTSFNAGWSRRHVCLWEVRGGGGGGRRRESGRISSKLTQKHEHVLSVVEPEGKAEPQPELGEFILFLYVWSKRNSPGIFQVFFFAFFPACLFT